MKRPGKKHNENVLIVKHDGEAIAKLGDRIYRTNTGISLPDRLIATASSLRTKGLVQPGEEG
jgi:hypothetical protein